MDILKLIEYRRKQILVNSCIYYIYGQSIISDQQFDKLARDLVKLNKENPEFVNKGEFWEGFIDFDGTTGYYLPLTSGWVDRQARRLIAYAERKRLLL